MKAEITTLKEEKARVEGANDQNHQTGSPAAASQPIPTPHEQRTAAVIGNLGWDTDSKTLVERARQVLQDAAVDSSKFVGPVAITGRNGKGSMAELCFTQPQDPQAAKLAVATLGKSFSGERVVWLDTKRERSERRPARIVHRMEEILTDVEAAMPEPMAVEKFLNGKYVKTGGKRAGYTLKGEWIWTQHAMTRYCEETRNMANAYAEAE